MKRLFILLFSIILLLSACNTNEEKNKDDESSKTEKDTITYESENGPIKVPAHPKRVVVLSQFTGDLLKLGVNVVGVDSWAKDNPRFKELKDVETVSEDNLEKNNRIKTGFNHWFIYYKKLG
jgi:iron complex transport system substrate-binding protein